MLWKWLLFSLLIPLALLSADCQNCAPCTDDLTSMTDRGDGLINWAKVDRHLYRGGQPFVRGDTNGYETLRSMGIKTIINLRTFGGKEGQHILELNNRTRDKDRRIYYLHIPLSPYKTDTNYLNRELKLIMRALFESPSPVFIHCHNGKDRTGMVVAAYRMLTYRWPLEKALREMELCHYRETRSTAHFSRFIRWWHTYRLPLLKPEVR